LPRKKESTALFLTDLHIGSPWGLWHPDYEPRWKANVKAKGSLNPIQARLWEYWLDLHEQISSIKPDLIFLLGDIIDGIQGRRRSRTALAELRDQTSCAISILRMLPRGTHTRTIGLLDSRMRDAPYLEANESLYRELGGRLYGTTGIFTIAGHSFRIYHGSTTAYIYLEIVMGRRRTFAQEAIARKKLPEIEGIICGHSHRWLHMRTMWRDGKDFHIVLCPGWEGQTDFQVMKDPDKMIPEIGAVIGRFGPDLVDFRCLRYPTPLGVSEPVKT